MKLLSVAIPCYNSAAYMAKAIESALIGGDEVEILIVNDGSNKDDTAAIADDYERRYPGICRAIHKPNGGHGDAVMYGLRAATGLYFKVVDSDDWLDAEAFPRVLERLRALSAPDKTVDLFMCNYIYDKVGVKHKHVVRYDSALKTDTVMTWDTAGKFRIGQYILMHSAIYRRQLLIDMGLELPKHTFYVDNLYVYAPMEKVDTLYYMNEDLYHYFIGRDDQSVHDDVMMKRIDQQLTVNRLMYTSVDLKAVDNDRKRAYMLSYLQIMCAISTVFLIKIGTEDALRKKRELWEFMREKDPVVYKWVRGSLIGRAINLPGKAGRGIVKVCYRIANKIFGFN